jgi:hypothetical protein
VFFCEASINGLDNETAALRLRLIFTTHEWPLGVSLRKACAFANEVGPILRERIRVHSCCIAALFILSVKAGVCRKYLSVSPTEAVFSLTKSGPF